MWDLAVPAGSRLEFRQRGNAECFEKLNLHLVGKLVDSLHSRPAGSDTIAERPLASRCFDDLQSGVGDFLRIRSRACNSRLDFFGNLRHFSVSGLAVRIFSSLEFSPDGRG